MLSDPVEDQGASPSDPPAKSDRLVVYFLGLIAAVLHRPAARDNPAATRSSRQVAGTRAIITMLKPSAIRQYSTTVAPVSSYRNLKKAAAFKAPQTPCSPQNHDLGQAG